MVYVILNQSLGEMLPMIICRKSKGSNPGGILPNTRDTSSSRFEDLKLTRQSAHWYEVGKSNKGLIDFKVSLHGHVRT